MPTESPADQPASDADLREASQTIIGLPSPGDHLATRLQTVVEHLASAGKLPRKPLLLWRDGDRTTRHAIVEGKLIFGRQPGAHGVALPEDKALSRRHFVVRMTGREASVEDLESRNGIAVNDSGNRIKQARLRDGDLILAGSRVFVFLDQSASD